MKRLEGLLTLEFHREFADIIISSTVFHKEFMDYNHRLLIDARDFLDIKIKIVTPKELAAEIPTELFYEYLNNSLASEYLTVYLWDDGCFMVTDGDEPSEENRETENQAISYVAAYKNGLLKEAYREALNRNYAFVFAILDGEAKVLTSEEGLSIVSQFGEQEDYDLFHSMLDENYVIILYIDTKKNDFWYDVLNADYEDNLLKEWGFEDYV